MRVDELINILKAFPASASVHLGYLSNDNRDRSVIEVLSFYSVTLERVDGDEDYVTFVTTERPAKSESDE